MKGINIEIKRSKEALAIIFIVVLVIFFHFRWLMTREVVVSNDTLRWYAIFDNFLDSLLNGHLPLWNPYIDCGEPIFVYTGILRLWDPGILVLLLFKKMLLIMHIHKISLFNLYQGDLILRYLTFIFGSYLFFKYITKNWISAYLALIVIAFSSCNIIYLGKSLYLLSCYLFPLIVYAGFRFFSEKRYIYLLALSLLLGIQLPGSTMVYTIAFLIMFFGLQFITGGFPSLSWKEIMGNRMIFIMSLIIFILLGIRMIPQILYTGNLNMMISLGGGSDYSFPQLFNLFVVSLHHGTLLYIGFIPLVFLVIGIMYSDSKYKIGFLAISIVLGLMLENKLFFNRFISASSILNARDPYILLFFLVFILSCLVAIGIDVIIKKYADVNLFNAWINSRVIPIIAGVCACAFLCNLLAAKNYSQDVPKMLNAIFYIAFFMFSVLFCIKVIKDRERYQSSIWNIVIFFILIDLFSYGIINNPAVKRFDWIDRINKNPSDYKWSAKRQKTSKFNTDVVPSDIISFLNFAPLINKRFMAEIDSEKTIYELNNYTTLKNSDIRDIKKNFLMRIGLERVNLYKKYIAVPKRDTASVLGLMSLDNYIDAVVFNEDLSSKHVGIKKITVEEIVGARDIYGFYPTVLLLEDKIYTVNQTINQFYLWEIEYSKHIRKIFRKLARLYEMTEWRGRQHVRLKRLFKEIKERIKIKMTVNDCIGISEPIVEVIQVMAENQWSVLNEGLIAKGDIAVESFIPNRVVFSVKTEEDAILFYGDGYDPFWKVYIDDKEDKIYKANLAFKAVVVPKGEHKVRFQYRPVFYIISIYIYLIVLALTAVIMFTVMIKKVIG